MATTTIARLETFTGTTGLAPIINANFQQIEQIFNPVHADHLNDGSANDVANVIRNRIFGDAPEVLTGVTPDIDFDTEAVKHFFGIDDATTFTFSNVSQGKFVYLVLSSSATPGTETLTWPASTTMVWLNAGGEPLAITPKTMLVKLEVLGIDGDADKVIATYYEAP